MYFYLRFQIPYGGFLKGIFLKVWCIYSKISFLYISFFECFKLSLIILIGISVTYYFSDTAVFLLTDYSFHSFFRNTLVLWQENFILSHPIFQRMNRIIAWKADHYISKNIVER